MGVLALAVICALAKKGILPKSKSSLSRPA